MASSLVQPLLQFMLWFAAASVIGSLNYGIVYWLRTRAPEFASFAACFTIFLLNLCFIVTLAVGAVPPTLIGAILLICTGGALVERKVTLNQGPFSSHFIALLCATFPALVFTALVVASVAQLSILSMSWGMVGVYAGLATTPSALPVFRWIWRSSKTHPGIDRHLDSSDEMI